MTEDSEAKQYGTRDDLVQGATAPLESILFTEELYRRPPRPPDYEKENRALVALARTLADSPLTVLYTLADTILNVLEAGSAGVSLLTKKDGGKTFHWPAIAGRWKGYIGGGTPRDFGPCGDVLDRNSTLLFQHVERRYLYFQQVTPPVKECLLVPFHVKGKAVGTIWVVAHDDRRKFDAEDERVMKSLGEFASSAYQILESLDAPRAQTAQAKQAEHVGSLLASIIDSSDDAIVSKSLDGIITSWNRGAERLFGYAAEEAIGQHIMLIIPSDRLQEEASIIDRLKRGVRVDHFETVRVRKDGKELNISLTISPIKDPTGRVVGASKVARDITERIQAEEKLRRSEEQLRTLANELESQVHLRTLQLEERNAEVLAQTEQLRELSNRLLQSQDEERRRIARDLHDSVGQIVTVLGMNFARMNELAGQNPEIGNLAEEGRELVRQMSKEIRTVAYLLHPPLLDDSGLGEAIHWYTRGITERSDLKIELGIAKDFGRLPSEMEVAIFRIAQECLTNIHRHSGGKKAAIRLARDDEKILFVVEDDGTGMPYGKHAADRTRVPGVGITGMRERVRHLMGTMDIESSAKGTKIIVTFPLSATVNSEQATAERRANAAE